MDMIPSEHHPREPLVRLVYISQRSAGVTDHDVVELALRASRRNRINGVTGCLWFGDRRFFQILEGPREVVMALFARVGEDRRHCGVRLLSQASAERREFHRWALTHLADDENAAIADLITHYVGNRRGADEVARGMSLSVFERVTACMSFPLSAR